MKKLILIFLFISYCIVSHAQGEAAHWYFGVNSGMDFMTPYTATNAVVNNVSGQTLPAVPKFVAGPINTDEGCFTISDKTGRLLFSSDGRSVYNNLNQPMSRGNGVLKGSSSASQSGIVIPRPGHPNRYYIVTTSANEKVHQGMHYYEVDMEENGGLGDVVGPAGSAYPTETQILLNDQAGNIIYPATSANENIAAVGHANGIDYWLVHRLRKYFFVWKVTKDGITDKADIYSCGTETTNIVFPGYTKFSADGKYIANAFSGTSIIFVGKFDNATGAITGVKSRSFRPTYPTAYTVEFSPNNKYLYFTFFYTGPVFRLSLKSLLDDTPETPQLIFDKVTNIQMGPDGRIYGIASRLNSPSQSRHLYIIQDPDNDNVADVKATYIPNYFSAANGSHLSLPNFTSSFFGVDEIKIDPKARCINQNMTFSVQINAGTGVNSVEKIVWDFGDGSPTVTDTNMNKIYFTQNHTYNKRGTYNVTLTPYKADGTTLSDKIQVIPIKIGTCTLPVNHNISNMEYFQ